MAPLSTDEQPQGDRETCEQVDRMEEEEEDDDDEKLFAALEAEVDLDLDQLEDSRSHLRPREGSEEDVEAVGVGFNLKAYREKRLRELQEDLYVPPSHSLAEELGLASSTVGRYLKLDAEKEVISLLEKAANADESRKGANGTSTSASRVVLHFSHPDFGRCRIMDRHLEHLAAAHPNTLFLAISPLKAPFLVQKMHIKILPHLVCFVAGAARDCLVGFDDLGNTDGFSLDVLEERLARSGVLVPRSRQKGNRPILGFPSSQDEDGEEWD